MAGAPGEGRTSFASLRPQAALSAHNPGTSSGMAGRHAQALSGVSGAQGVGLAPALPTRLPLPGLARPNGASGLPNLSGQRLPHQPLPITVDDEFKGRTPVPALGFLGLPHQVRAEQWEGDGAGQGGGKWGWASSQGGGASNTALGALQWYTLNSCPKLLDSCTPLIPCPSTGAEQRKGAQALQPDPQGEQRATQHLDNSPPPDAPGPGLCP